MFSRVMVGSNDIQRSKRFYDLLFGRPGVDDKGRLAYLRNGALFMASIPINGKPACQANGGTIDFLLDSPAEVDAWHASGIEGGALRSRIRQAGARAGLESSTSLIFGIPTATSCALCTARPKDLPGLLRNDEFECAALQWRCRRAGVAIHARAMQQRRGGHWPIASRDRRKMMEA
jgi:catechol 2,3-dioxygenase-like lactoylglutathione lyase family enzyme